jgi:multiple sugar transport system permease protein
MKRTNKLKENQQTPTFVIHSKIGRVGGYAVLLAFVILVLAPLIIVFNVSLKDTAEYWDKGVYTIADNIFNFSNYIEAFKTGNFLIAFKNTFILIGFCVPTSLLLGTMVAYALGRFEFKLKPILFAAFIIPTFVPMMTVSIATFTIIKALGLYNTIFAGMLLYIGSDIVQIYIFLQFIRQIPVALDESAKIDGASRVKIYFSIILPQMKPAIATSAILKVLSIYNDFFTPYLFMPKSSLRTVATALNTFAGDKMANWPLMSAAIIFVAIPTVIIYLLLQKQIIGGVTDGAVK